MDKVAEVTPNSMGKKFRVLGKSFLSSAKEMVQTDVTTHASSLAFSTVLSIAPLIAILFYVFKIFGGFEFAYARLEPFILNNLSEGTGETVANALSNFIKTVQATTVGWVGVAGLLLSAITVYLSIARAFQRIWKTEKGPSIRTQISHALILLTFGPILALASVVITTALAAYLKHIPFTGVVFTILLDTLLFTLTYYLVPPVKVSLKAAFLGSILPAILWETAKAVYAVSTTKFLSYSKFYGSLAAIPLFLLWIYIAWLITLFGAVWIRTLTAKELE